MKTNKLNLRIQSREIIYNTTRERKLSKNISSSNINTTNQITASDKQLLLSVYNRHSKPVIEGKKNISTSIPSFNKQKINEPCLFINKSRPFILFKSICVNFNLPSKTKVPDTKDIGKKMLKMKQRLKRLKFRQTPCVNSFDQCLSLDTMMMTPRTFRQTSPIIQKNMTISSVIAGQLSNLSLGVIHQHYDNYIKPVKSNSQISTDYIQAFAANTFRGIYHEKNNNKIVVVLKVEEPKKKKWDQDWPTCSIFGIFDGSDGDGCSEYLSNHLHQNILKDPMFPRGMDKALIEAYEKTDYDFLHNIAVKREVTSYRNIFNSNSQRINQIIIDKSSSCALEIFIINNICYVANAGDSRAYLITNNLENYEQITNLHNSSNQSEQKRILINGGTFQTLQVDVKNYERKDYLPCYEYVFPGKSRTTRVMGLIEGKMTEKKKKENNNEKVLICSPDVHSRRLRREVDFILAGNNELFTKLSMKDILECIRMIFTDNTSSPTNLSPIDIHSKCSTAVELIIKTAQHRNTTGNLSCILIMLRK